MSLLLQFLPCDYFSAFIAGITFQIAIRKMHKAFLYFMDLHLVCFDLNFSPVHIRNASHAFNPLPVEHLQSLHLLVVKGNISTHIPDVNQ